MGCLGLALPQLEGTFVVAASLRERVHLLGGGAGGGQRRDRASAVTRRDPVVRELGRGDRHAADLATPFQFATERRVQAVALAVQQLVVGHLGQEGVAEGIAAQPARRPGRRRSGSPG